VSLGGPLLYNRLHEIADQERGMRQIPSPDSPLKASRRLSGLVWKSAGVFDFFSFLDVFRF
jgi:hypothetical protein